MLHEFQLQHFLYVFYLYLKTGSAQKWNYTSLAQLFFFSSRFILHPHPRKIVHYKKNYRNFLLIDEFHEHCKIGRNIFHIRKDTPTFFHKRWKNLVKINLSYHERCTNILVYMRDQSYIFLLAKIWKDEFHRKKKNLHKIDLTLMSSQTFRTDSTCHGDIYPDNICPSDICLYQEYTSCYWPDFDQTLKVASLDHLWQIPTVMATFVHISIISAVTDPILKMWPKKIR